MESKCLYNALALYAERYSEIKDADVTKLFNVIKYVNSLTEDSLLILNGYNLSDFRVDEAFAPLFYPKTVKLMQTVFAKDLIVRDKCDSPTITPMEFELIQARILRAYKRSLNASKDLSSIRKDGVALNENYLKDVVVKDRACYNGGMCLLPLKLDGMLQDSYFNLTKEEAVSEAYKAWAKSLIK